MSLISDVKDHIEELKKTESVDLAMALEEKIDKALEFQLDLKLSSLIFEETSPFETDICWAKHLHVGSITVVDRMTGFGNGRRDIESGFRDPYGKFWLASGNYDIRSFGGGITVREAIGMIKDNANICKGE